MPRIIVNAVDGIVVDHDGTEQEVAELYRKHVGSTSDGVSFDGVTVAHLEGITIERINELIPPIYEQYEWSEEGRDAWVERAKAEGYEVLGYDTYRTGTMNWDDPPGWRIEYRNPNPAIVIPTGGMP